MIDAVAISAPPNSRPRSDGLMGAASTFTTTSSGPGAGVSTCANDSSRTPSEVINERNCSPETDREVICDVYPGKVSRHTSTRAAPHHSALASSEMS